MFQKGAVDNMKILLLEDDKNLHSSLKAYLEFENFDVSSAYTSDDVYELTYSNTYDLYIFDVNVPGDNGFKVLKLLKKADDKTPTIYTTALSDISSISNGFEAGADDYIKSKYMKNNDVLKYKKLDYKPSTKELYKDENLIILGDVLGHIFHELILNKNKIVPADILYEFLEHPNPNALRVNISKLKTKLDLDIKNIRGVGYMLEEL
jgi:DNA-binding response OmpR family regulator